MSRRHNNQLPNNLPQLQNLIKRDPESYKEEFQQQWRHFTSTLQVFELSPGEFNKSLEELVMFLAQVAKCYPEDMSDYPQRLIDILKKHSTVIDPDMRMSLCRALVLLRHKDLLALTDLLQLFFDLLKCQDKTLRKFLRDHIVTDLKNVNAKHKDAKLNTTMITFMATMLKDAHRLAAKTALDVMIELYRKNVWRDERTVNVISSACFSDVSKLSVTAIKFFLGTDNEEEDGHSDDDEDELPSIKDVAMANKVNKKSRKRERMLENIKKAHKKKKKEKTVENFNFSALHLIHDPQTFAEKLFKKLDTLKEKFEVKLMFLDLVSRLIGTHELILLNYYSYIARFLTPHQREVIHLLQYSAQAAHELVPPDAIEPVLRAIVNNFVTERNSSEVMAIGLNAVRELCKRCPLVMDDTLLSDLSSYKSYKDKAVMMAARSLIQLFRTTCPELLHKKDRGRPTEASADLGVKKFGENVAKDFVPGAEVVDLETATAETIPELKGGRKRKRNNTEGSSDDDWEDVVHSSDDEDEGEDGEDEDGANKKEYLSLEEKAKRAAEVTSNRLLTDADFKRIDAAQLRKQVQGFRKGGKKRKIENYDTDQVPLQAGRREELVDLANIEMIHSKRKHDKDARLATVMAGREDRGQFGSRKGKLNEHASTTNKQKLKNKSFMMMKHKLKSKAKKSFVDKQRDLKKALLRSKKFK